MPLVAVAATACAASQAAPVQLPPHTGASLGQSVSTANGNSVAVVRYVPSLGRTGASAANVIAAVDVKACASATRTAGARVAPSSFLLLFHDGMLRPVDIQPDRSRPALRTDLLPAGQCTQGWVFYRRPHRNNPIGVVLSASTVVLWKLT